MNAYMAQLTGKSFGMEEYFDLDAEGKERLSVWLEAHRCYLVRRIRFLYPGVVRVTELVRPPTPDELTGNLAMWTHDVEVIAPFPAPTPRAAFILWEAPV